MESYSPATASSPCLDVDQVIRLEKQIEASGTPLSKLMDQAGSALADFAADRCAPGSRILVLCGSGNNGGDGWVAARLLDRAGYQVAVATPKAAAEISAQPAHDAAVLTAQGFGGTVVVTDGPLASDLLEGNALVMDCILGTGFDHDTVKEPYATWIRQANEAEGFKLACDAPSGLSAQTGKAADPCFKADATVTMLAMKTGLAKAEAAPFAGQVYLAPLEGR